MLLLPRPQVSWEGEHLVSTLRSKEGLSDIVTRRWVEEKPGGSAMLVQETSFQNIRYRRSFRRVTG